MSIPFYINPATGLLELTADPSPLRESLGKRFNLDKISTSAKTLSPIKSYAQKPYNWEEGDWWDLDDESVGNTKILEDFEITEEMRRRPNAEGGRIGLKEGTPKLGSLIIDFIVKNRRQPKPSEVLQLKEKLRVMSEVKSKPKNLSLKSEVIPGISKIENIPESLKKGVKVKGLVPTLFTKVLPPVGAGLGVYFSQKAYKEGKPIIEVLAEFFGAGQIPYKIVEYFKMTDEEQDAVKRLHMTNAAKAAKNKRPYRTYDQETKEPPSFVEEGDAELIEKGQKRHAVDYQEFLKKKRKERLGILQLFQPQKFEPNV
jgi:hypothetical protein